MLEQAPYINAGMHNNLIKQKVKASCILVEHEQDGQRIIVAHSRKHFIKEKQQCVQCILLS